jgi:subtilase family serine protease
LAESDETNNAASSTVTCQVTAADLTVSSVYFNGDTGWKVFADVANIGSDSAPATQTQIAQDGQSPVLLATPALAGGETTTVSVDCPYGSLATATATADAGNAVTEANEANNSASGSGGTGGRCRYP